MTAKKNSGASGGKTIGYVRVSSIDQNDARQLDGLELDKTFTDKASGKDTRRPQLQAMLDYARDGDRLLVHSMDCWRRPENEPVGMRLKTWTVYAMSPKLRR